MADQHNQQGQQQQQHQQQGTPQQQHQPPHPELNFSIQEILADNSGNDVPFQTIVQNMSHNNEGSQQAYASLPPGLQSFFASNGAGELGGADPSVVHQHVQEILWNNNHNNSNNNNSNNNKDQTKSNNNSNTNSSASTPNPIITTAPQHQTQWVLPMSTPMSLPPQPFPQQIQPQPPQHASPQQQQQQPQPIMSHQPTPIHHQQQQQQSPAPHSQQSQQPQPQPQPLPPGSKATTLLENIISQLSPERREEFMGLFRKLQTNSVSPEQFYIQAKSMLGQQQYQQLEDLKNKPSPQDGKDNDKKRAAAGPSGQGNQQMTGIVTPQLKRVKTENNNNTNIPPGMPMGPPISNPMNPAAFKPPQAPVPNMPGLQVPPTSRPTALPGQQQSTPAKSNASTPAPGQANAADRIDYDQLTDVMGYAGVDLREEEQHFMKDGETPGGVLPDGVDRSKTQEFMNSELLKERVLELAKPFGLEKLDSDFVSLLALATQERLRGLAEQMVIASKHRTMSQHVSAPPPVDENGQPLYKIVIQQDTKKQLLAIERAEREEEQKRKEAIAERERRAQMGKEGAGGEEGRSKSKKKDKDSSQQRSLGDGLSKGGGGGIGGETALMKAIGGVRKSWMLTGNARDQQSSSSAVTGVSGGNSQQQQPSTPVQDGNAPGTPGGSERGGDDSPRGRGRPRGRKEGKRGRGRGRDVGLFLPPSTIGRRFGDAATRKVTVRDALFALERDCQAGGQGSGQKTLLKTYNQWLK